MDTRLTKEEQAMIKEAKGNKVSGPIYSEDGLRLLKDESILRNRRLAGNDPG